MILNEALQLLKTGYCLWVGAGISRQLAGHSKSMPPQWHELVLQLEKEANVEIPLGLECLDYPERIGLVLAKMGRYEFAKKIREMIYERLASAILESARTSLSQNTPTIPNEYIQIATLGRLANPIVNFNVERLTSYALAGTNKKHVSLKVFTVPDIDYDFSSVDEEIEEINMYKRHILHPHGAIDSYGRCILSNNEYATLEGTLALQLSVHAAFQSNLAIVGMSMNDEYLRIQLSKFRQQIKKIFWFMTNDECENLNAATKKFVLLNNIHMIKFDKWPTFWGSLDIFLPRPDVRSLVGAYEDIAFHSLSAVGGRISTLMPILEAFAKVVGDSSAMALLRFVLGNGDIIAYGRHKGEDVSAAISSIQFQDQRKFLMQGVERLKATL